MPTPTYCCGIFANRKLACVSGSKLSCMIHFPIPNVGELTYMVEKCDRNIPTWKNSWSLSTGLETTLHNTLPLTKFYVIYQEAYLHSCWEKFNSNFPTYWLKKGWSLGKQEVDVQPTLYCLTQYTFPYQRYVLNIRKLTCMVAEKKEKFYVFKQDIR